MAFSSLLMGVFWAARAGREPASFGPGSRGKKILLLALSGFFLGVHFALWVLSLSFTSVAVSVVLVNTQPVFAALLAWLFLGEAPAKRQAWGIAVALAGVTLLGLTQGSSPGGPKGSLLALGGALSGASYYVVGRSLRPRMGLWAYVTPVYAGAGLLLLLAALAFQAPLGPFPPREWLIFAALAAAPTLFGHTLLNWALRWLPAPVVNLVALGEPVGASFLAAVLPSIGEVPRASTFLFGGVILAGIFLALGRPPAVAGGEGRG